MEQLCPKHKIQLKIKEDFLHIHGEAHLVTKGLCAHCGTVFINRTIFPGNSFFLDGVRYETLDSLCKSFPYDAAKEVQKLSAQKVQGAKGQQEKNKKYTEKQTAKAKANKSKAVKELEEILKKNPKHAVNVDGVVTCEQIPEECPGDKMPLTYVKNVHHKKWRLHGMCCLACKKLFLTHEQLAKFKEERAPSKLAHQTAQPQKKISSQKTSKAPNSVPASQKEVVKPSVMLDHLPDSTILTAKIKRLDVKAERTVAVVAIAEDQNSHPSIYWVGRGMAAAILYAIHTDPKCRFEHKGVQYEVVSYKGSADLYKYLRIISRFCDPAAPRTIHVFAHKNISAFQNDDYEAVTAMIPCAGRVFPVATTVYYEKKTSRYFMNEEQYKGLRDRYGLPHLRLRAAGEVVSFGGGFAELKPNSELNLLGYNVNASEGLTTDERRKKLGDIIDSGVLRKVEVMNHIEWCIKSHKNILNHENAVSKWREDLLFVQKYKMDTQRIVWIKKIQSQYTPFKSL